MEAITWIAFALISGVLEAFLFANNPEVTSAFKKKYNFDIHALFNGLRAIVALVILFFSREPYLFLFCPMVFPFFHDGAYYQTRHWIDGAYKHWFDQSSQTSAKLSFYPVERVVMLLLGLLMYITAQVSF